MDIDTILHYATSDGMLVWSLMGGYLTVCWSYIKTTQFIKYLLKDYKSWDIH